MAGSKYFIVLILCIIISGCYSEDVSVVYAELVSVTDSKPCSDSVYIEILNEEPDSLWINPRSIRLWFEIRNTTNKPIYLPMKNWTGSSMDESFVQPYIVAKEDTIYPYARVTKIPYDNNIFTSGDSMLLFVDLRRFEKWSTKDINASTDLYTILAKVRLKYNRSPNDEKEGYKIPDIKFDTIPQFYYVIPRGKNLPEI